MVCIFLNSFYIYYSPVPELHCPELIEQTTTINKSKLHLSIGREKVEILDFGEKGSKKWAI